jgi:Zn-dependent peptidase ImmA (M78 family)/DNA-binding XRE family transcriptional regulator
MPVDQSTLAARLKGARDAVGLTQEDVAEKLSLPRTAIVQIEGGGRAVSSLELAQMAELYQREFGDFLADSLPAQDTDPLFVLHRIAPGLENHPQTNREVEACVNICHVGVELESALGRAARSGPPAYELPAPTNPTEAILQGEHIAGEERRRLGLGDAPLADLSELLNGCGLWASGVRLPSEMSGLFISHRSIGMVVLVNNDHPELRRRFSFAHEYAHVLMDRNLRATVSKQENAGELIEKRANTFAAAFLMPANGVREVIRKLNKGLPSRAVQGIFDVASGEMMPAEIRPQPGTQAVGFQDAAFLAHWFKVSYQAASYRLLNLAFISLAECKELLSLEDQATRMMRMMSDLFNPTSSPRQPEHDTEARHGELIVEVVHLVLEAYRQEKISRGRVFEIAKLLGLPGRDLFEFAEATRSA